METSGDNGSGATALPGVRGKVFADRYALKDSRGRQVEQTIEETWARMARGVAAVESEGSRDIWEATFRHLLDGFKFVPSGRIHTGAGSGHDVTLFNCFVIDSPEDSCDGIFDNLKILTQIMRRGGGVGVNLSTLRPSGAYIKSVNGHSTGPVNWGELYSDATGKVIQQGGSRRGALMLMLDDDHPDILNFIRAKRIDPATGKPVALQHANISVAVSDAFMAAVEGDAEWRASFPTAANLRREAIDRGLDEGEVEAEYRRAGRYIERTFRAREIWDAICACAHASAEPGLVFMERCNRLSNTWYTENLRCVNPCVTGDTLIFTAGGLRRADQLASEGVGFDLTIDGRFDAGEMAHTAGVFATGEKPVYRVRTREGYSVRATADHRLMTTNGWVEVRSLTPGAKLHILDHPGGFGEEGTLSEGRLLGWLVGDGHFSQERGVLSFFGDDREHTLPVLAGHLGELIGRTARPTSVAGREESRLQSRVLGTLARGYEVTASRKHLVPGRVYAGSEALQRGFLQGLFTADGSVQGTSEKGFTVRLAQSDLGLLEGVQRLLLNFGIASRIYRERRGEGDRLLPDGRGGIGAYHCAAQHELAISKANLVVFAERVGFLPGPKADRLEERLSELRRGPYRERFTATVESIDFDGVETVYDLTEPITHSFVANGIVVHNCGEQILPPYGVCNLGHINLAAFVVPRDGESRPYFDFAGVRETVKLAVRFLDDVTDASGYFLGDNEAAQKRVRRIGLGTMGLADALIALELRYGSPGSLSVIDTIYATIRDAAYSASADLAAEKGAAPAYDAEKFFQGPFIRALPAAVREEIARKGIRNLVLLSQAPTGTTSLLAGVSSGIEPVFAFAMRREDRTGESVIAHPGHAAWVAAHPGDPLPEWFVAAGDLTVDDHVAVQAAIQRHTDSAISKTVNGPNGDTVADVDRLYRLAYAQGLKGVTYYRDGSRDAVLTAIKPEVPAAAPVEAALDGLSAEIAPRPAVLHGYTRNITTPVGTANVTVNDDEHGPAEVFVNVGKTGSDLGGLSEALGRLMSLALRLPSPIGRAERLAEIAAQLRGIGGTRTVGFGPEQVRSLPDAIGKALDEHAASHPDLRPDSPAPAVTGRDHPAEDNGIRGRAITLPGNFSGVVDWSPLPALLAAANLNGTPHPNGANGHAPSAVAVRMVDIRTARNTGAICPECSNATLAYAEGCRKCHTCGYAEC